MTNRQPLFDRTAVASVNVASVRPPIALTMKSSAPSTAEKKADAGIRLWPAVFANGKARTSWMAEQPCLECLLGDH